MGIVIRQSAKSVLITYLGIGIGVINTLWLFPYILTEGQIGLIRTIINVAVIFSTFACLGAANIPVKFFPYFKDYTKKHNGFFFFLILIGLIGFIIFALLYVNFKFLFVDIFAKNAPALLNYFYRLLPFTFILVFINIFEIYNVVQQKPVVPILTRELLTRIFLSFSLLIFFFTKFSYDYFVDMIIGFYGIVLIILIFYTYSQKYLFLKPNFEVFKNPILKSILVFASFILMGNASGTIILNVDTLLLSAYSGLKSTGIYTIAFFIATFIEIPKKSLSQVLIPMVSEANKNNDVSTLENLYKKSSITQSVIGSILFILIWFNIDNIFRLIPHGGIYSQGKWVVFFIGLGKIFDMGTGINQEIVGTSKYYKIDLAFYPVYGLLAIAANMFFIPKFGMVGAAIATFTSLLVINTLRLVFLFVTLKIQPFSLSTLKVIGIILLLSVINYFLPHIQNHFLIDILTRSAVFTFIFIFLIFKFDVSEDVNAIFIKIFNRIRRK